MANRQYQSNKWIFVSHASEDLERVRDVRNYLEEQGASPLLFHLLSLKTPDQFWALIESEIEARNFFLYCESPAAQNSPWVQKERRAVQEANRKSARRIGTVDVTKKSLDCKTLDDFLSKTRVFPAYSRKDRDRVEPYLAALEQAGYQVFRDTEIAAGEVWKESLETELKAAARNGWVVLFLSNRTLESQWVLKEIVQSRTLDAKILPVTIEPIERFVSAADELHAFDGTKDPDNGPAELARMLLIR